MKQKFAFLILLVIFLACITVSTVSASSETVKQETAVAIIPHHVAMFGNGPAVRFQENMRYYPSSAKTMTVGEKTVITLYKGINAEGKLYIFVTFADMKVAQDFISDIENLRQLQGEIESYATENHLDTLDKVWTGLCAYAGTNDRPGVEGMKGKHDKQGFAIAFRVDPIQTTTV